MSFAAATNIAMQGLQVTKARTEIVARNISNENTPGYREQTVVQDATIIGGTGGGPRVTGVVTAQSPVIEAERLEADAEHEEATIRAETASTINRSVGDPDDEGSLFDLYADFESSLRRLQGDPASATLQTDAVSDAQGIARAFNDIQTKINDERTRLDREIEVKIGELNDKLDEFARLNNEITRKQNTNVETAGLETERNALLSEISTLVAVKVEPRENGTLKLSTTTGFPLAERSGVDLVYSASGSVNPSMTLAGGTLNGVTMNGVDVTPPNASSNVFSHGEIAALFEGRDVRLTEFQGQMDALATDLIRRFDNTNVPGLEAGIAPGDYGLFSATGVAPITDPGLAGRLEVNPLVTATPRFIRDGVNVAETDAGRGDHVENLLDAFTTPFAAPGSGVTGARGAADLVSEIVADVSAKTQSAERDEAFRAGRRTELLAAEQAAIGVDMDKQLQELTLAENAYAANAQVIRTIDEMIRLLLEL